MATRTDEPGRVWIYVRFERDGSGYLGKAPGLPGCFTWGASLEEAKANLQEAIAAYAESARANNIRIKRNKYIRKELPLLARLALARAETDGSLSVRASSRDAHGEWQKQQNAIPA